MRYTKKSSFIRQPRAVLTAVAAIIAVLASTSVNAQSSGSAIIDGNRAAIKTYFEAINCAAVFRMMRVQNESAMQAALSVAKRAGHSTDQKVQGALQEEMSYLERGDRTGPPPTEEELEQMLAECRQKFP